MRTVLGEELGIGYSIDPRVTGRVSIITAKPTPALEIFEMFETAIGSIGAVMLRDNDRLHLIGRRGLLYRDRR